MKKLSFVFSLLAIVALVFSAAVVSADEPLEGRAGRAEIRFLEGMIDHHQMAVDMATDCVAKATTQSVVDVCQNVIDAQTAEIETMQTWLMEWYNIQYVSMPMSTLTEAMAGMEGMGGHGMAGMEGMPHTDPAMTMGMFAGFNRLEGTEYEVAWLESMIDHHDDAIHMSERILERVQDSGHRDLVAMAQQIIEDQTGEIEEIETILTELGG